MLNGKLIQYRGEVPPPQQPKPASSSQTTEESEQSNQSEKSVVIITTEFKDVDRGMTFSSIATQIVEESGLDVVVFTGPDQTNAVKEFLETESAIGQHVRIHISQHGVMCVHKNESKKEQ